MLGKAFEQMDVMMKKVSTGRQTRCTHGMVGAGFKMAVLSYRLRKKMNGGGGIRRAICYCIYCVGDHLLGIFYINCVCVCVCVCLISAPKSKTT